MGGKFLVFKSFRISVVLATILMLGSVPAASAAPFTGQIDYTGVHTSDNADLDLANQSAINFAMVVISDGSFAAAGINVFDFLVHTSPIVYRPVSGAPYAPLWSHAVSGVSFKLDTMSIVFSSSNQINLTGLGVFSGGGFDDTDGVWNMTLNNTGSVIGSFSSSGSPEPISVPEPAILVILGIGLVATANHVRKRKA